MLHAQWVERKHFGSWIQPLEPSVEDLDIQIRSDSHESNLWWEISTQNSVIQTFIRYIIYISSVPPVFSKFEFLKVFSVVASIREFAGLPAGYCEGIGVPGHLRSCCTKSSTGGAEFRSEARAWWSLLPVAVGLDQVYTCILCLPCKDCKEHEFFSPSFGVFSHSKGFGAELLSDSLWFSGADPSWAARRFHQAFQP